MTATRCRRCGAEGSTLVEGSPGLGEARGLYCPGCWDRGRTVDGLLLLLGPLVAAAIGAALLRWGPLPAAGFALVNVTLVHAGLLAAIVPHEAGHALAARLVGWPVARVVLGAGPVVWSGRRLEVRALPTGGWTVACPPAGRGGWARRVVFVLGGPAATGGLLAAALPFARLVEPVALTTALHPVEAWIVASSLLLARSLAPIGRSDASALLSYRIGPPSHQNREV